MEIQELTEVTPDVLEAAATLVRQLSSSAPIPSAEDLREIVRSPSTILLLAKGERDIMGMLTLVLFRIPTGVRAIIEDVVVDEAYRGRGIAEALTRVAIDRAQEAVDLTSRPSRVAANRLYQKLGFRQRESNVYRFARE